MVLSGGLSAFCAIFKHWIESRVWYGTVIGMEADGTNQGLCLCPSDLFRSIWFHGQER